MSVRLSVNNSFRPSVRPSGTTLLPLDEFSRNLHLSIFRKYVERKFKSDTASQATADNTTRHMRIACCITKATDTHSEYVILIAFPMAIMVTRTRLNVTFTRTLSVLLILQ